MEENQLHHPQLEQAKISKPEQDEFGDTEVHTPPATDAGAAPFLSVMSPYEMEILTRLFPKSAQTLADVLRKRAELFTEL
jgi:hypothetical protein